MNKLPRENWFLHVIAQDAGEQEIYETLGDPNEWKPGQIAVLSVFGIQDFVVVSVLSWDQVKEMSTRHKFPDDDTIVSPNPFGSMTYKRDEGSVPVLYMDYYGSMYRSTHNPGDVSIVGPQNLYRTLGDLMRKQTKTLFAELIPQLLGSEAVLQAVQDYPQLKDWDLPSDFGEYHSFDVQGYEVQIVRDPRAYIPWGHKEPTAPYYWYIVQLDKRSLYSSNEEGMDLAPMQTGRFPDIQTALASATKYVEYADPSLGIS